MKYWIKPDIENRIKEGAIPARVRDAGRRDPAGGGHRASRPGGRDEIEADAVFLLTGYTPDVRLLSRRGALVDPETLVPEHDPRRFETSVPGLFIAGAIASGRDTSRIFIENGRFHGEAIVTAIVERQAATIRP